MNKNESKYFNTAIRMDEALVTLLEKKDLNISPLRKYAAQQALTAPHSIFTMKTPMTY